MFLREYDFRENDDLLIMYFYVDSRYSRPSLVLRLNVVSKEINCRPVPWLSVQIIREEICRIYDLIQEPYWKSFVRTCSFERRFKNYELFEA